MSRSFRPLIAARSFALVLVVTQASGAIAQVRQSAAGVDTAATAIANPWKPRLRFAAWTDPAIADGNRYTGSMNAIAGIEWQSPIPRITVRSNLEYLRGGHVLYQNALACNAVCRDGVSSQLLGATAEARLDLLTGTFRPYLVGGIGAYHWTLDESVNARCEGETFSCVLTPGTFANRHSSGLTAGLHAGFGIAARVGRLETFGEFRARTSAGPRHNQWAMPLVFGIRF